MKNSPQILTELKRLITGEDSKVNFSCIKQEHLIYVFRNVFTALYNIVNMTETTKYAVLSSHHM